MTLRLGTIIVAIGIVILIVGISMDAGSYSTELDCSGYGCEEVTSFEPNDTKPLAMALGGWLTTVGAGGWVGAYNSDWRRKRSEQ